MKKFITTKLAQCTGHAASENGTRSGFPRNGGFSLIECVVAITLFSVVIGAIGSSLVMAHRINARSEVLIQEQLKVSRAVEGIMASGIRATKTEDELAVVRQELSDQYTDVIVSLDWGIIESETPEESDVTSQAFYQVVVTTTVDDLKTDICVSTCVRALEGGTT